MDDFERRRKEFDRQFEKAEKRITLMMIPAVLVSLAVTGVVIWVLVELAQWIGRQ